MILANPVAIDAYRSGVPVNGKPFPHGSKIAKIHWNPKKSAEAPAPTTVPDTLHDVDFMVRDSKRFADSGGWGYAEFDYDAASDTFAPLGNDAKCGFACHSPVAVLIDPGGLTIMPCSHCSIKVTMGDVAPRYAGAPA